jgi:hypothetical protein
MADCGRRTAVDRNFRGSRSKDMRTAGTSRGNPLARGLKSCVKRTDARNWQDFARLPMRSRQENLAKMHAHDNQSPFDKTGGTVVPSFEQRDPANGRFIGCQDSICWIGAGWVTAAQF